MRDTLGLVKSTPAPAFDGVQVFVLVPGDLFEAGCERAEVEHVTLAALMRRLLSDYVGRAA